MTTSNIEIVISLEESNLDEEELQEEVENLLPQIKEVDGVEDAGLVEVTEVPEGSKSIGGLVKKPIAYLAKLNGNMLVVLERQRHSTLVNPLPLT